jgi:hypothetical protein
MLNILTNQVKAMARNRIGFAIYSGARAVVVSFARTFYVLWLQTTGLMFAVFTLMGASAMVKLQHNHARFNDPHRYWITLSFTAVCLLFTVVSFFKAKRRTNR